MYKSRFGMDFEIFKNQGLGNVRTAIDDNNQIWFVAKDITDILEIQNTADALKNLDKDEIVKVKLPTNRGVQSMMLLNESGMYSLVLRSRKPQANEFKNWLTHNVIPSIREHGGYIYQQELLNEKEQAKLYDMIESLQKSVTKFKTRWHELNADKRELKNTQRTLKKEIKSLKDYADTKDKMYDDLFNDFEKVYAENKALKAEKYAKYEAMTSKNSNNSAYTPRESEFEADYYMDNQGFLVKNDVKDNDKEDIDMSDRDGNYDLDI